MERATSQTCFGILANADGANLCARLLFHRTLSLSACSFRCHHSFRQGHLQIVNVDPPRILSAVCRDRGSGNSRFGIRLLV
jgi:hypothetical protein